MDSKQRVSEWENLDSRQVECHRIQWDTPKQSTLAFEEFIKQHVSQSKNVIDMGAGAGASTSFLANKHTSVHFTAFDYSEELNQMGNRIASEKGIKNLSFEQGDWYNLDLNKKFDGCVSLQTLSWLPDYEAPLLAIFEKINPEWIAISSLFYEGDITCRIEVEEYKRNRKTFCNTYSLPAIRRLCEINGYILKKITPFEIEIDITKPTEIDYMGTYTEKVLCEDKNQIKRLQISGPLLMNWYILLIEKVK